MNAVLEKLKEELEQQEQYCAEFEEEFKQNFGHNDEASMEQYLRARLSITKNYALNLDHKLQTEGDPA